MANLTPDEILDKVQARITDQSAAMRVKLLGWLNEIMHDVVNQPRNWQFLKKSASIAVAANALTLPADFGTLTSVQVGDRFFTPDEALTDEEAYFWNQITGEAEGYTISGSTLTFVPGTSQTSATVKYNAVVADVIDDTTATIFPQEFRNILIAGTLMMFYEYDHDDNYGSQVQLYQMEMKKLKALDNKKTPLPKRNPHGYIRERL